MPAEPPTIRHRLLVVDDDAAFRETVCEMLAPWYALLEASSGREAIELVESESIDVALLDMHMPAMTGLETIRVLKQSRATMPCILVTADLTPELAAEATRAAASSVLSKPVTRRRLVSTVAAAVGGSTGTERD